jgi:hypothetical protein
VGVRNDLCEAIRYVWEWFFWLYGRGRLPGMTSTIVVRASGSVVNGKSRFRVCTKYLEQPSFGQGRDVLALEIARHGIKVEKTCAAERTVDRAGLARVTSRAAAMTYEFRHQYHGPSVDQRQSYRHELAKIPATKHLQHQFICDPEKGQLLLQTSRHLLISFRISAGMQIPALPTTSLPQFLHFQPITLNGVSVKHLGGDPIDLGIALLSNPPHSPADSPLLRVSPSLILSQASVEATSKSDRHLHDALTAAGPLAYKPRGACIIFLLLRMSTAAGLLVGGERDAWCE